MISARHILTASVVLAGLAAGASGCSSSAPTTAKPTPVSTATSAPASVATSSTLPGTVATTAPAATTTTAATGTVTACTTSMLSAALSNANGAAGTIYYHLVFTNTSASRSCTIQGYPGVSFVDGAGNQIGAPVPRLTTSAGGAVTLGPGSSAGAQFLLRDAYVGSVAGCMPTTVTGLRVYPPNQTAALSVPAPPLQVCANPATPGSASIGPVTSLANLPG